MHSSVAVKRCTLCYTLTFLGCEHRLVVVRQPCWVKEVLRLVSVCLFRLFICPSVQKLKNYWCNLAEISDTVDPKGSFFNFSGQILMQFI